ncbi:L,D-transpeptidase [Aliisedimentitalea scapharcae]|uniref:L,D-transpeptidase n=1 Tax=Aliisedimentitalea scapharcae TaxID=1524259 RepID=A0ABZ2XW00_9RHOB|nr:L,D-transpeptidase [Rhodobacteraceae bacterium M382]
MTSQRLTRRTVLLTGAAYGAAAAPLLAQTGIAAGEPVEPALAAPPVRRNISSFRAANWQDHFDTLKDGAILCDIDSRAVQFWSEDQSVYKMYPSSVPLSEDLTKRGYTTVIRKVEGPSWRPTPSMKERNPEWPDYWPPGPDNPLGTHALYLSWQYYRVHGTGDTRKIGRKSSNGCVGLYNEHIAELFALAKVGTQVKLF